MTIFHPMSLPTFMNSTHRPPSTPWASLPATSRRWGCGRSAAQSCRPSGISFLQTVKKADMMTTQNNTKHPMKGANSMEITYRMQDGFQVPNLLMPQTPEVHLGKYAELRRAYLKKRRRVLYTNLKTSGKLTEHLAEIEQTARKMVEQTVAQMARAEGVTEALKATDPMRWTGLMNNLRHSAEELVLSDLIYA
ncbi:TnpV protein [Dysosmobacter sp.]|uniref:TnpV protein n=2 Tax=Dysosmobacter sp. TaxID=2591382 RepID=UPI003AABD23D